MHTSEAARELVLGIAFVLTAVALFFLWPYLIGAIDHLRHGESLQPIAASFMRHTFSPYR
ncbi:MAG TPA: hypothetical protein VFL98_02185 [Candidatus Paceibacterota bacterium]|nr:hypothetical protein [Candidatus Paceibacterota bacterium]